MKQYKIAEYFSEDVRDHVCKLYGGWIVHEREYHPLVDVNPILPLLVLSGSAGVWSHMSLLATCEQVYSVYCHTQQKKFLSKEEVSLLHYNIILAVIEFDEAWEANKEQFLGTDYKAKGLYEALH